jgi:anti-sigma regulatory factor (Ser/Thr protein kinase)
MSTYLPSQRKPAPAVSGTAPRVGQIYLDVQHRQLHCLNPGAQQLHNDGVPFLSAELERTPLKHLDGSPVTAKQMPLAVSWEEQRPVEAAFMLERPGAVPCRVSWHTAPVRDADGRLLGIVGTVLCAPPEPDWSEMAGLAHDLRTPLSAIRMQMELLDRHLPADLGVQQILRHMRSSAERALRVGMDLLEWCRGPASRGRKVEPAWFPLEPFLTGLAQEQVPAAEKQGIVLAVELAAARGWEVYTDSVRLGRLLSNLLVNAVRYTLRGRVELNAAWREDPGGRVLALGVVDTGVGIAPEEQESIFEPFAQGKAGKDSHSGGSGLGLAVVEKLIQELGLELEVSSEYGRGSAFHLLLPTTLLHPQARA